MVQPSTERFVVGLVRGLHGLRGAVRLEILTDDPARFAVGSVLRVEGTDQVLTVTWSHHDGPGILVRFREIPDRNAAESLRDRYLEVDASAEPLPDGAYWWHQIIGSTVTASDGRELGTVTDVFRAGGGEVYVVEGGAWGELMIPAVASVVLELDPATGRIVVDANGLDLDDAPPVRRPRGRRTTRAARAANTASSPVDGVGPSVEAVPGPAAADAPPTDP